MFQALRCILQSVRRLSKRFSETKTAPMVKNPFVNAQEEICAEVGGRDTTRSKLTKWLKAFEERHLMHLEDKDTKAVHVQTVKETMPQMSRLTTWLTKFEKN
ncbi:hypothetical protein DVH05_019415 [Phytophthora capsici]|nr:hypothetical protein DVH05_019415 [Phytophthora capsici]